MRNGCRFVAVFLLFGSGAFWSDGSSSAHAAGKNVVLVVADDHSPDMGCYGNPVLKTPNLDALAAEGTRFVNAFCTTASCSASRSVILSGLHNHANGQYGHQHHFHKFSSYDNLASLPVYLTHAGYRTARCGKYHVAPEPVYQFEREIPGPTRNGVAMAENCRAFISEGRTSRSSCISVFRIRTAAAARRRSFPTSRTVSAIQGPGRAFRESPK